MIFGLLLFVSVQLYLFIPAPHNALLIFVLWLVAAPAIIKWIRSAR